MCCNVFLDILACCCRGWHRCLLAFRNFFNTTQRLLFLSIFFLLNIKTFGVSIPCWFTLCSLSCPHYVFLQDHAVVCPNKLISCLRGEMRARHDIRCAAEAISSCFALCNLSGGFHWLCCLACLPVDVGSATVAFHAHLKSLFLCHPEKQLCIPHHQQRQGWVTGVYQYSSDHIQETWVKRYPYLFFIYYLSPTFQAIEIFIYPNVWFKCFEDLWVSRDFNHFFLLMALLFRNTQSIVTNPECRCSSCCRVTILALARWRCRRLCVRRTQRSSDWRKSSRPRQAHGTTPSHRCVFRNKATSKKCVKLKKTTQNF